MARRGVVITGVGIVSPAGLDADAFWSSLVHDRAFAPHVDDELASDGLDDRARRRHDPAVRWAMTASDRAMAQAGQPSVEPQRGGVVLGVAHGALPSLEAGIEVHRTEGPAAVPALLGSLVCESTPASSLSIRHGLRGPSKVVAGACASATFALTEGAELVASGKLDLVLAGGVQGPITEPLLAAYRNLKVLSPTGRSLPFDRRRDGFAFGEGGAVFVLEPAEVAAARGATVLGVVLGGANTNDASHPVTPSGTGAVECIEAAIADAGVPAYAITHVNAHGTGTRTNDAMEAAALHQVLPHRPAVTSTKRATGHAAGAAGAIEAAAVVLAFGARAIPPSGFADHEADPELDVDVVVGEPRAWEPAPTLSTSFGIGGHNGAVVLAPPGWSR